ncbi:LysR family transcriptional regulator [Ramlibacter sp.]|uniref:LysR family transcriptional regulator n=1 Tax=Ramlibacter sp. TaxID=1917967 RepID=UPI003D0BA962
MRKLTITNLELAVWIGKLGSFTAAAERMHTTQPAVSARVKELEDILGHKLFVRQGRGVELTPEGREFVGKAENLLRQLDALSISFAKSSIAGVVRLGASSMCLDLLAKVGNQLAQTMPLVSFEVDIDRAARQLDLLEARKIDVAMLSGPVDPHKFRTRSLGYDRMLWVTSREVLRQRADVPASERLAGLPIWCVHADSFYFGPATKVLRAQGANVERNNATGITLAVVKIVSAGCGIGLVSESMVRDELARGVLVPLPDLPPCDTIELSVVTMADSSSTIIDEVVEAATACSEFRRTPF